MLRNVKNSFFILLVLGFSFITSCSNEETGKQNAITNTVVTQKVKVQEQSPFITRNNDISDGDYEERYASGVLKIKGIFSNGQRHGTWMSFYENGTLWSEGTYVLGKREGRAVTYHPNGKIYYEGHYSNGEESGIWKYYDNMGILIKEEKRN